MSRAARQWGVLAGVVALLAAGAVVLLKLNPDPRAVELGAPPPTYPAVDIARGDTVVVPTAYRGQVTLVNVWATYCLPCREGMPWIQEIYAEYKDRGFAVASVSIDPGDPAQVADFQRALGLTFDMLHDQSTRIQGAYQTTGVPESFLLDRQGRIVKRVIGAYDWRQPVARQLIERLLAEPRS